VLISYVGGPNFRAAVLISYVAGPNFRAAVLISYVAGPRGIQGIFVLFLFKSIPMPVTTTNNSDSEMDVSSAVHCPQLL